MRVKIECPDCYIPGWSGSHCIKCGCYLHVDKLYQVDIAHDRENLQEAALKLNNAVEMAWRYGWMGLKVVHGYGSRRAHTSVIKDYIQPWLRRAGRCKSSKAVVTSDRRNKGVHLLYFNRKAGRKV